MKDILKLIRIKHWLKNVIIFMPLFFSKTGFTSKNIYVVIFGFLAFSLIASIVYIINDIKDVNLDKKHQVKKNRPIASGRLSINVAIFIAILLFIIGSSICIYLYTLSNKISCILIPAVYLILNILYSFKFKNIPILDIVILSSGFLFRLLFGGAILSIAVSKYLSLTITFGAFYLGFGKRRNEILKNGNSSRKVLQYYNKEFLDKNMYVALTLAMVFYTLWTVDPITISSINNNYLIWTVPFVLIIFQTYSLDIEGNSQGDPIEVVLSNKFLIVLILLYITSLVGIIYIL